MKKLIWIGMACLSTAAFANQVINQQYVTAAPNMQRNLQQPFTNHNRPMPSNAQTENAPKNPMAIYVKPSQQTQQGQEAYQGHPYQRHYGHSYNNSSPNTYTNSYSQGNQGNQAPQQQQQHSNNMQWHTAPSSEPQGNQPASNQYTQPQYHPAQQQHQNPYAYQYHNNYPAHRPTQQYERNTTPNNAPVNVPRNTATLAPSMPRNTTPNNAPENTASTAPSNASLAIKDSTPSKANNVYNNTARTQWFKHCMAAVTTRNLAASAKAFCECGWQKISTGGINPKLFTSINPADTERANVLLQNISQQCLMDIVRNR